jgi:zinc transport system ATP-binding protein
MPDDKRILVEIKNVGLQLNQRVILEDVDLKIHSGEIISIIGPNGAGKSMLLKVILGLIQPSKGSVTRDAELRVGYMPQKLSVESLMPLTVARFLMLSPGATLEKSRTITAELGIDNYLNSPIQAISGGEFQRVLLARALLNSPNLLVLDEPAQGVDITAQAYLYNIITNMREKLGCAILMVSHDLHLVVAGTDRVVCLNKHICCSGNPATITRHPEFIHLFGSAVADNLAIYTHKHDHRHDLEGNIIHD